MKKIFVTAAIAGMLFSASAQIPKGSIFGGLNLGFNSGKTDYSSTNGPTKTTTENYKTSSWNLIPNVQYFFQDNFSVGLGLSVNGDKSSYSYPPSKDKTDYASSGMGINLFARKYMNCGENFHTFLELNIGSSSSKGSRDAYDAGSGKTTTTTNEYHNTGAGINLGFAWLVTPRVMFQGTFGFIGFNSWNNKYNINTAGDKFDYYNGSSLGFFMNSGNYPFSLGFAYRLNK